MHAIAKHKGEAFVIEANADFIANARTDIPALCDLAEQQAARIAEMEASKVWGLYEEEHPVYAQGGSGGCELAELLTAEEANGLVRRIAELEAQLATAENMCGQLSVRVLTLETDLSACRESHNDIEAAAERIHYALLNYGREHNLRIMPEADTAFADLDEKHKEMCLMHARAALAWAKGETK